MKQQPTNVYIVWDWWLGNGMYYAIYYKEVDSKLYFSEAQAETKKEKPKLLEQKKKINFLKRIIKWIKE